RYCRLDSPPLHWSPKVIPGRRFHDDDSGIEISGGTGYSPGRCAVGCPQVEERAGIALLPGADGQGVSTAGAGRFVLAGDAGRKRPDEPAGYAQETERPPGILSDGYP